MIKKTHLAAAGAAAVAASALVLGLSGAYASGHVTARDSQARILWAVVNSDATFARRSKGITSVVHVAPGQYRVVASSDVRNCAYQVTGGDDGLGVPPRTYGDTAQGFFDARSTFVEMYDASGTRIDSDFYLTIFCGDLTGL
jgi:hypothetical protein